VDRRPNSHIIKKYKTKTLLLTVSLVLQFFFKLIFNDKKNIIANPLIKQQLRNKNVLERGREFWFNFWRYLFWFRSEKINWSSSSSASESNSKMYNYGCSFRETPHPVLFVHNVFCLTKCELNYILKPFFFLIVRVENNCYISLSRKEFPESGLFPRARHETW